MFILHLLSKHFRGVSPRSGSTLLSNRCSSLPPRSSLLRHLPYHLVQRCRHRFTNCPGRPTSRWDRPSTLRPVDIGAAFSSPPPIHQVDIRHGYRLVVILAGAVCNVWQLVLVQTNARVGLYLFSTVTYMGFSQNIPAPTVE